MSEVNTELSIPSTTTISLNQANVRSLAAVPTGTISMSNLQGKSASFSYTTPISIPVQNFNLRTAMIALGYPGSGAFTANFSIAPGIYVWSDTTATAAFDTGALSGGSITVTNDGFIMGKGGDGNGITNGRTLANGGLAINLQHPMTLTNNSNIGGGGGGGGGAYPTSNSGGGGGQGGGAGGSYPGGAGGAGGAIGLTGANGVNASGGGGGRVFPGVGAVGAPYNIPPGVGVVVATGRGATGGGGGGVLFGKPVPVPVIGTGSAGGAAGVAGGTSTTLGTAGGGGGFGAAGGTGTGIPSATTQAGGLAGKAITLNGNTLTRPVIGNTYGAVS
jgi:hypothetical protein